MVQTIFKQMFWFGLAFSENIFLQHKKCLQTTRMNSLYFHSKKLFAISSAIALFIYRQIPNRLSFVTHDASCLSFHFPHIRFEQFEVQKKVA